MNDVEALKYIVEEARRRMITHFNMNELPHVPDFYKELEDIMMNMPELESENYDKYINAALSLMLKMTLEWVSTQDGDALRTAFNALSSNNINEDKVNEMENMLNNPDDEEELIYGSNDSDSSDEDDDIITDIPGDEEEDI